MRDGLEPRIQMREELRNELLTHQPPYEVPSAPADGMRAEVADRLEPGPMQEGWQQRVATERLVEPGNRRRGVRERGGGRGCGG